jgi:hypothetical protein
MKITLLIIVSALLLFSTGANAQAPSTIAGDGFLIGISSGTSPLASYGYFIFLAGNSDDSYNIIDIYGILGNSGTYTYTDTGAFTGIVGLNDTTDGLIDNINLSFSSASQGSFFDEVVSPPADQGLSQSGDFVAATGTAINSVAGMSLDCSISDGLTPFASSGSFTVVFAATGNTYVVTSSSVGIINSSGTYSYSIVNRSTASIQLNDSVSGASTLYVGFSNLSSGGYAVTQASRDGFQVGSFSISNTSPWPGAASLGNGWMNSSWFGTFNVNSYPWIYHQQHGWMYVFGTDPTSIWLWTPDLGFLWTSQSVYPWLWSDTQKTWLYYSVGSSNPRYFYNWNAQKWVSVNP